MLFSGQNCSNIHAGNSAISIDSTSSLMLIPKHAILALLLFALLHTNKRANVFGFFFSVIFHLSILFQDQI